MTDIAPALYEKLHNDFESRLKANGKYSKLWKKADPTYRDAQDLSELVGDTLQRTFQLVKAEDLPDETMYYNIAERTVKPLMEEAHDRISAYTKMVQEVMNSRSGLKMKAAVPDVPEGRISGIIDVITEDVFDEVKWILTEPITNCCMSTVVDFIQANADLYSKAGIKAYIVRTATSRCCEWCSNLVGTYEYPVRDDDVYRRHENCRCTVEFHNEREKYKQDVWSKEIVPADTRSKMLGRYKEIMSKIGQ